MAAMDDDTRRAIALFRFGVLGPLVSARLEHGDRRAHLEAAAAHDYVAPDGRIVRPSVRTIEAWYYAYRRQGLAGLTPSSRGDCGTSRAMSAEVADLVVRAKQEKPRRSIRRIIRMLERAGRVRPGELSRSSVHRLLAGQGISQRPTRAEDAEGQVAGSRVERRSYIAEHVGDLWVGDALHVRRPVAFPDGGVGKAYMLSQIDSTSRCVPHSYFARHEEASDQEHGLRQAILKYGVPRTYYVDRGAAYVAGSLVAICAELGCRLLHAGRQDAEAKGVIERWHRTWREEVEDELPPGVIALSDLASAHYAWLAREYHLRVHDTTRAAPRARFLAEVSELRAAPSADKLAAIFLHRRTRTVRKDAAIRWEGGWLEVRPELVGKKIELRFDPRGDGALPKVFREGRFYCDTAVLDRIANAHRQRRRIAGEPVPGVEPTGIDPLAQLVEEHAWASRLVHLSENDGDDDESEDTP
jgi:transposase InsO family protein